MQGTSPYANGYQSPSYHSSSYMPKLEAQFMKDFSCCGIILASLHDLLQHYEEAHAQQPPPPMPNQYPSKPMAMPNPNIPNISQAGGMQHATKAPSQMNISGSEAAAAAHQNVPVSIPQGPQYGPTAAQPPAQDMEAVEDMEMDDEDESVDPNMSPNMGQSALPLADRSGVYGQRAQYGPPASRMPGLNLDTMQHENPLQNFQGIRQSQPNTPVSGGRPGPVFHNNPTVSSVNTPTLSAHPRHPRQLAVGVGNGTPDSSAPGTPHELDPDFVGDVGNMSMDNTGRFFGSGLPVAGQNPSGLGYAMGGGSSIGQLYIDEPAKALAHPQGGGGGSQDGQSQVPPGKNRLGNAHYGPDSPLAKTIREQQRKVGLADTVDGLNGEPKPFRCPVIGCEKAYKNQNGLKYHKAVRPFPSPSSHHPRIHRLY